jgi:amidohydrolase
MSGHAEEGEVKRSTVAEIKSHAKRLGPRLVAWRRHLHMHPEPSMQEHETGAFVEARLREIGVDSVRTGVGETGVVGLIRGRGRRTVGLRADMDALELEEANQVPYRSRRPGLMHACGHDGHVACLLGTAAILKAMRNQLPGNVKLIFQPGEEGAGGAARMIADGVLEKPKLSAIAALHVDTETACGKVAIRRGYHTAQVDDIALTVRGKTSHVARPDLGVDAISVACQVFLAIQQFVARHTNALDRKLIGFGLISGGTRMNVVADRVRLEGTIRTIEPEGREALLRFLKRDASRLAASMGARLQVEIRESYPPLANDDRVVDVVAASACDLVSESNVVQIERPVLGGEDFSYFALAGVPAAMFGLGIRDEKKGFAAPGHNANFDFPDRRVLPLGAAMLAAVAVRLLEQV